jgi:hypothetical protein
VSRQDLPLQLQIDLLYVLERRPQLERDFGPLAGEPGVIMRFEELTLNTSQSPWVMPSGLPWLWPRGLSMEMRTSRLFPTPLTSTSTISIPSDSATLWAISSIFDVTGDCIVARHARANKKVGFRPLLWLDLKS